MPVVKSWFKDQFVHKEVAEAQALGVPAEQILDRCLQQRSPGVMGLMVQPYWGPGLDYPKGKHNPPFIYNMRQ